MASAAGTLTFIRSRMPSVSVRQVSLATLKSGAWVSPAKDSLPVGVRIG